MFEYIVGIKLQYLKNKFVLLYFFKKKKKKITQKGTYLNNKKVTKTDLLKIFCIFAQAKNINNVFF